MVLKKKLSKVLDCIMHDLLIPKLQKYGFDNNSLNFICNYFLNHEQRIKLSSSFTTGSKVWYSPWIHTGAMNMNTLDIFFEQKDVNFAAYGDDNTPYFCDKNLKLLLSKLQICALKLLE